MKRHIFRWLLAGLLLGGCAAPQPVTSGGAEGLELWVGRPLPDLVSAWGTPSGQGEEAGCQIFFWSASRYSRSMPANLNRVYPATFAGTLEDYLCRAVVTVDENQQIIAAEWRGQECP